MRTVHVIRHAYGTTVQVEDRRVYVNNSMEREGWSGRCPPGKRSHFLPTAASLRRLRRIVLASWKARAAQVTTYTEAPSEDRPALEIAP